MKATVALFGALVVALVMTTAPAWADHNTPAAPAADSDAQLGARPPGSMTTEGSLDIDLKLGLKGFRFGSRLFGKDGYAGGAWLNGETRSEGFTVDGRLERDGRAHNFKMNVELDEWLRRAARWWTGAATDL